METACDRITRVRHKRDDEIEQRRIQPRSRSVATTFLLSAIFTSSIVYRLHRRNVSRAEIGALDAKIGGKNWPVPRSQIHLAVFPSRICLILSNLGNGASDCLKYLARLLSSLSFSLSHARYEMLPNRIEKKWVANLNISRMKKSRMSRPRKSQSINI